jgi:ABC-type phosphate transport system substrate-binding protein
VCPWPAYQGYASGSSLQAIAQQSVWLTSAGWGSNSHCTTAPTSATITYTPTSSGEALNEFGNNTGALDPAADPTAFTSTTGIEDAEGEILDWYVGTDDAPTATQIANAEQAAGEHRPVEMTIPVAQDPIAVLLSLPPECKIPAGSEVDLDNTTLAELWAGEIAAQGGYAENTWGALLNQLLYTSTAANPPTQPETFFDGGRADGCSQEIEPQVSSNESGTAYAFKAYLNQIDPSVWSTYATDSTSWPWHSVLDEPLDSGPGTQFNDSEGHLSQNTAAYPGSVGYAAVSAAMLPSNGEFTNEATVTSFGTGIGGASPEHQILWAEIQNDGTSPSGATYADPLASGTRSKTPIANCQTRNLTPSDEHYPHSVTGSWHGILATDPNIWGEAESNSYSICALTYDLVWHHYHAPNLYLEPATAEEIANTVKDLFEYITGQGQTDVQNDGYTGFPTPMAPKVTRIVSSIRP